MTDTIDLSSSFEREALVGPAKEDPYWDEMMNLADNMFADLMKSRSANPAPKPLPPLVEKIAENITDGFLKIAAGFAHVAYAGIVVGGLYVGDAVLNDAPAPQQPIEAPTSLQP